MSHDATWITWRQCYVDQVGHVLKELAQYIYLATLVRNILILHWWNWKGIECTVYGQVPDSQLAVEVQVITWIVKMKVSNATQLICVGYSFDIVTTCEQLQALPVWYFVYIFNAECKMQGSHRLHTSSYCWI